MLSLIRAGFFHPEAAIVIKAMPESSTSGKSFGDPVELGDFAGATGLLPVCP